MILEFFIIFFLVFLVNYLINYVHKKKNDDLLSNRALSFIIKKYKIKLNDKKINILSKIIVVVNTLIITIPVEMIIRFEFNYFIVIAISFISFIVLILVSYNLIGYILKKKGW